MNLSGSDLTIFSSFFGALRSRLSREYQNTDYRGCFKDYCDSKMSEIMDTLIPPVFISVSPETISFDKDKEVKEAFDDWYHNIFKLDCSNEKENMLKAWKAAQEVYEL